MPVRKPTLSNLPFFGPFYGQAQVRSRHGADSQSSQQRQREPRASMHAVSEPIAHVTAKPKKLPGRVWEVANTPLADLAFGEGKTRHALVGNVDGMIAAAQRELDQRAARGEQIGYWDALKTVGLLGAGRSAADVVAGFTSPLSIATGGLGPPGARGKGRQDAAFRAF